MTENRQKMIKTDQSKTKKTVESKTFNQWVVGSIPTAPTKDIFNH